MGTFSLCAFVANVFTGRGKGLAQILRRLNYSSAAVARALDEAGIARQALPRDVQPQQWAKLYSSMTKDSGSARCNGEPLSTTSSLNFWGATRGRNDS